MQNKKAGSRRRKQSYRDGQKTIEIGNKRYDLNDSLDEVQNADPVNLDFSSAGPLALGVDSKQASES